MPKLVGAKQHPKLYNGLEDDPILDRSAKLFLPEKTYAQLYPSLHALCDLVIDPKTLALLANTEHDLPYIKGTGFSSFGHPVPDALVTSPGWKELQDIGIPNGIVATGYDSSLGAAARVAQFLKLHQWGPSSAVATCPSAMQDGAANVLLREIQRISPASCAYDDKEDNRSIKRKVYPRRRASPVHRPPCRLDFGAVDDGAHRRLGRLGHGDGREVRGRKWRDGH